MTHHPPARFKFKQRVNRRLPGDRRQELPSTVPELPVAFQIRLAIVERAVDQLDVLLTRVENKLDVVSDRLRNDEIRVEQMVTKDQFYESLSINRAST